MLFGISPITHSNLKVQMEELRKENESLKYANAEYKKRLESEMASASFSVDWKRINAFSIERMWENGIPKTIIGYMLTEPVITTEGEGEQRVTYKDVVREWTYYCSAEKHEELVKQFIEYKGKEV